MENTSNTNTFMSKRAIITGGSAGIGLETAKKFYINGFDVMLCARNQENLNRAKQELEQLPSTGDSQEVRAIQADFSKERDVDRFASEVLASSGTIDVLVHNAGIFLPGDLVGENLQAMRDMMEVNFFSAYHLNQLLLPKNDRTRTWSHYPYEFYCRPSSLSCRFNVYYIKSLHLPVLPRRCALKL